MAKLVINSGNRFLDGEYELDLSEGFKFTKTEWFLMKRRVGVVTEDLRPGSPLDMSVKTALGLVALHRAGKEHLFDTFMDTTDDQTVWEWGDDEVMDTGQEGEESLPPKTGSESPVSESTKNESSGPSTDSDSESSQAATPPATGSPPSETTAASAPAISGI
jgi:hypothetical protein